MLLKISKNCSANLEHSGVTYNLKKAIVIGIYLKCEAAVRLWFFLLQRKQ